MSLKENARICKGVQVWGGQLRSCLTTRILSALEAKAIPTQFPKGSLKMPSEAKANIWTNWQAFTKLATQLEQDALALKSAAQTAQEAPCCCFGRAIDDGKSRRI